jgi:hypothetical protein
MSWAERLLYSHTVGARAGFCDFEHESLRDRVDALIRHQTANWSMLRDGYQALEQVRTTRLQNPDTPESYVIVQHNPARIRSTAAPVDQASVQSRKCFLCPENLPAEEMGLEYGEDFIIACNPFPVLNTHLSIIHRQHVAQEVDGKVETLLELARDLGPDYLVLYNGPRCGASAPDHLHLQACSSRVLPIKSSLGRVEFVNPRRRVGHSDRMPDVGQASSWSLTVGVLEDFGRNAIVLRGSRAGDLGEAASRLLANFARATGDDSEPMINIVSVHHDGLWTVYLFPRARHRPACYFAHGEKRITVSPGAIDMAGVIVVPRDEDFARVGAREAIEIFSEVSASKQLARDLAMSL